MKQSGSSLIIVLFVVSVLTILLTVAMRNATFALDIALQQTRYAQQRWAAEGILNYGIAYTHTHATNIIHKQSELTIPFQHWHSHFLQYYTCFLKINSETDHVKLLAQLKNKQDVAMSIRCQCALIFDGEGKDKTVKTVTISDWQIDQTI